MLNAVKHLIIQEILRYAQDDTPKNMVVVYMPPLFQTNLIYFAFMQLSEQQLHLLTSVENLLERVSPQELRHSLEDLFFSYLSEPNVVLPSDELVQHVYYLLLFLREIKSGL